ncbi:MAG: response regulator, partial [Nannocystaceae bacterium]|nr:response regulator [Nannocystaceae bacterium]
MSAGHGRAILFVDDDLGLAKIAHRRLTRQSHRVTTVHSGEEAVRWLDCHDVDLVVLDHSLPDTSAEELVDRLKLNERVFDFIAISGQGDEQVAVSLMKRGALDYVVKDGQFWSRFDAAVETALKYLDAERELARTKKTLDAAEQRLEQVASSICEVFWLADTASGRFEYVSPAFE